MSGHSSFYFLALYITLFGTTAQAVYAWTQLRRPGAAYLSGYALAATVYIGATTLALISPELDAKAFWYQVRQTGSVAVPVLLLALLLHALGQGHRLTLRRWIALSLEPIVVGLAAWTNPWHGLIWQGLRLEAAPGPSLLAYEPGPLQMAHFVYLYTFSVIALGWSFWQIRRLPPQDRRRGLLLILGSLPPLVASVVSLLRLNPLPVPLEPYGLALTAAVWSWAVFRSRLFSVFLVAREDLIETMDDAVIVLDTAQRVADMNAAAQALFKRQRDHVAGLPAAAVWADQPGLIRYLGRAAQTRVALEVAGQTRYYDLRAKPLRDRREHLMGWLILLRDVTLNEQSARIQAATYQIAQAAASPQSLPELYHSVHTILNALLPVRNFYIALYDPAADEVSFPYFVDEREPTPPSRRGARGLTEYVIRTRQPQLIPYSRVEQLWQAGEAENLGEPFVDWLGVPLASTEQVRGALITVNYDEALRFGDTEKEILAFVSTQISQAIERKQAEASLRDGEQRFRLLAENSLDVIARTDPQGRILYISPACQTMLGFTPEELTGRSWLEIIHPDDLAHVTAGYAEMLNTSSATPRTLSYRLLHRGGHYLWLEANLRIICDPHTGEVAEIQSTARDITARQLAEEALRTRERFLEALNAVTRAALQTSGARVMLTTLCEQLQAMFSADGCYLALWDERQKHIQFAAGTGTERETFLNIAPAQAILNLADHILKRGQPLALNPPLDASLAQFSSEVAGMFKMASALILPLIASDERLGLIVMAFDNPHTFTETEIGQGEQAAGQIALALAKLRALELAERRAQEAETLRRAGAVVAATLEQAEAIERILEQLATVVPYQTASVQLLREGEMVVVGGRGWPDLSIVLGVKFPIPGDNPNTRVVQERQPIVFGDVTQAYPYFLDRVETHNIRAWLGVPLITKGQLIGLITLDSAQPNYFTADHTRLAAAFADQVAIAIENAQLYAALRDNADELEILYRASARLLQPAQTLADMGQRLIEVVTQEFLLAECSVLVLNADRAALHWLAATNEFVARLHSEFPLDGPGLIATAARTGRVIYAPDVTRDPRYLPGLSQTRSELVIPLQTQGRLIGVFNLESDRPEAFSERDRRMITAFAEQAALALENAQLLARLEIAHREAQAANRLKSDFLANTSHELRTPLTGLLGSLDMVLDDMCDSPEEEREFLRTARQAGGRLLELINNLLDLSKIEAGKFELAAETLDVLPVLGEVYSLLQIKAEAKKLALNLQFPPEPLPLVWADAGKVRQILINLVGNAIKFTERGGVTLSLRPDPEARQLRVIVQDTGIGIRPDQHTKVFEPFFQIDGSTTRRYGGTGLGLSIAQRLAAMMHGQIDLYSAGPGQGSTFTLTLPLASAQTPTAR